MRTRANLSVSFIGSEPSYTCFVRKYPRQCPVNAHRYTMQPTQVYYKQFSCYA